MSDKQFIQHLLLMFQGDYGELYSVVDDNNFFRKSGVRFTKRKEYPDGDVEYVVTINKIALEKWLGGKG